MDIHVGDMVQMINGAIDVTNGNKAKSGRYYGEDGPLWATVELIDEHWNTGGRFGLDKIVTKIRCVGKNGVVVWQVRPEDISPNIIRASQPNLVQVKASKAKASIPPTQQGLEDLTVKEAVGTSNIDNLSSVYPSITDDTNLIPEQNKMNIYSSDGYIISSGQQTWGTGIAPTSSSMGKIPDTTKTNTKFIGDSVSVYGTNGRITYESRGTGSNRKLNSKERKNIGPDMDIDDSIKVAKQETAWKNYRKRSLMLNNNALDIQNSESFPKMARPSNGMMAARYNYQIIPGDKSYRVSSTLEDKLMEARASLGIPVHGNNRIAKAVKYYMYNRFKVPDRNLAHNKSVTHVFFTRPDLNLLTYKIGRPIDQILNHPETALIWRKHPELFKLLTDCRRCNDSNNFNLLLSNQVTSFDIQDERISSVTAGESWNEYKIHYGDAYTGRSAGEFSCNFTETSDYSIINLLKLWITYIDNVSRGEWSPSYNLWQSGPIMGDPNINQSHVYTKTLDYAASAYVFKCGPDGEDVLYWSKYFGVFPVNTGANALSWELGDDNGAPKLNIQFKYSFKRDMSPISLIEFNNIAGVSYDEEGNTSVTKSENSFNTNFGHTSRPYVGTPFIQMNINHSPTLSSNGVNYERRDSNIRLKYATFSDTRLTDDLLYRR